MSNKLTETRMSFGMLSWLKEVIAPTSDGPRDRPCTLRLYAADDDGPVVTHVLEFSYSSLMELWRWADSLKRKVEGEVSENMEGRLVRYRRFEDDTLDLPPLFEGVGEIAFILVDDEDDWVCYVRQQDGGLAGRVLLDNLVFVEDDDL